MLGKHAELDTLSNQGKTALHHAIEKNDIHLVRALLNSKANLEITSRDGDTALLLAVKRKFTQIVNELLIHGSYVWPTDLNGENVLHISLRYRHREITQLILADPKNSKYLYKANKKNETPYKIDASNPKSILTQIFGTHHLNMSEENLLGYDMYSSAIAELLSEPNLLMPITVGLYAKWASSKSFLLNQLRNEMNSFAHHSKTFQLHINWIFFFNIILINLTLFSPLIVWRFVYAGYFCLAFILFEIIFVMAVKHSSHKYKWADKMTKQISISLSRFELILKVLFLNANESQLNKDPKLKTLRFLFTDYGKICTFNNESSLALMVANLYEKIEDEMSAPITRICQVFQNNNYKNHLNSKRFKRFCCLPSWLVVFVLISGMIGLIVQWRLKGSLFIQNETEFGFVVTFGIILIISLLSSSRTWFKIILNLIYSPKKRIMKIKNRMNSADFKVSLLYNFLYFKILNEMTK